MKTLWNAFARLGERPVIHSIRRGLVMTIPLLMIGSVALILNVLPIPAYREFIQTFAGGFLSDCFVFVNQVTFGVLALCSVISISVSYTTLKLKQTGSVVAAVFASLATFMILNGFFTDSFAITSFGAQGMFTAIFSAIASSTLFCRMAEKDKFSMRLHTVGADSDFNNIISLIMPMGVIVLCAFVFNWAITALFDVYSFEGLFHMGLNALFDAFHYEWLKSLMFVVLTNIFWFFGIHGTNVLDSVAKSIFYVDGQVVSTMGGLLSKPVIDSFVLMGGCGTTISLLVAILLFSKQKNNRSLAKMATLPMLFNINELMVFGLPIVFNPFFFLPFILVPLACVGTSILALWLGLVPIPTNAVEWVTPVIINGYQATGSVAGSLLQLFNIAMGTAIYRWFLVRYERQTTTNMLNNLDLLIERLQQAEKRGEFVSLLDQPGGPGSISRMLAEDLRHVLKEPDSLFLYYQPQYHYDGSCYGAEALLRWKHPLCGIIYPPLLIGIAEETGQLRQLERSIFQIAAHDIIEMKKQGVCPPHVSVNVTAATLQDPEFMEFLGALFRVNPEVQDVFCIELTEQMSFLLGEALETSLVKLRTVGVKFAVDDFSMGHTSVKYLQTNLFDLVKLDGSLITDLVHNQRSQEIVSSIVHMANNMNFAVLAEYVEVTEQRDLLERLGCHLYQGYLYSPAVPLEEFMQVMHNPPKAAGLPSK